MSKKLSDSDERLFDKAAQAEAPVAAGAHVRTMTMFQGTAALTKTAVGAGLLSLAATFAMVGWVIGTILMLLGAVTTLISLYFYGRLSVHLDTGDFVSIARRAHGLAGQIIVVISILCYLLGPMIGYILLGGKFVASLVSMWGNLAEDQFWASPAVYSVGMCVVLIFPLTFLNDMSKLSYTSIVGMAIMLYVTGLTLVDYIVDKTSGVTSSYGSASKTDVPFGEIIAFPDIPFGKLLVRCVSAFCVMLMAYISHTSIPSITHSMINPSAKRRLTLMGASNTLVFALYFIAALFGYLHFGQRLLFKDVDMILLQKTGSVAYQIGLLGVFLVLSVSYPLILLPFRESVDWLVCTVMKREMDKVPIHKSPKKIAINVVTLGLTCLVACLLKSPMMFFSLSGAFGSMIGFILPSLYMLSLSNKINVKKSERVLCYIMIFIGVIVLVGGLATAIMKLSSKEMFGDTEFLL
jgi:amino acid permease